MSSGLEPIDNRISDIELAEVWAYVEYDHWKVAQTAIEVGITDSAKQLLVIGSLAAQKQARLYIQNLSEHPYENSILADTLDALAPDVQINVGAYTRSGNFEDIHTLVDEIQIKRNLAITTYQHHLFSMINLNTDLFLVGDETFVSDQFGYPDSIPYVSRPEYAKLYDMRPVNKSDLETFTGRSDQHNVMVHRSWRALIDYSYPYTEDLDRKVVFQTLGGPIIIPPLRFGKNEMRLDRRTDSFGDLEFVSMVNFVRAIDMIAHYQGSNVIEEILGKKKGIGTVRFLKEFIESRRIIN